MPKFNCQIKRRRVDYGTIEVEASSKAAAIKKVQRILEDDDDAIDEATSWYSGEATVHEFDESHVEKA